MDREQSDAELIRRSVDEPTAFELVFQRRFDVVHNYLRRRVGADLADELAAEAFARAFSRRASFRPLHDSALPWLFGIASNLIADQRRAERRRWRALEREASSTPAGRPAGGGERGLNPELARAVSRLHARDRDALLLVAWGELSYDEVAAALGVPVGTVRSRINRARRQLAGQLGEQPAPVTAATGESHV